MEFNDSNHSSDTPAIDVPSESHNQIRKPNKEQSSVFINDLAAMNDEWFIK